MPVPTPTAPSQIRATPPITRTPIPGFAGDTISPELAPLLALSDILPPELVLDLLEDPKLGSMLVQRIETQERCLQDPECRGNWDLLQIGLMSPEFSVSIKYQLDLRGDQSRLLDRRIAISLGILLAGVEAQ